MQTTNIQQKYKAFVRSYQSMPKVAKVVIEWNDNHQQHEFLISLDDYWIDEFSYPYRHTKVERLTEEDIFYHAGNIQGLYELVISNAEDFKIIDIIDFY